MTNEGAIEKLVRIRHTYDYGVLDTEDDEALDMAIAALEQAPTRYSRTLVVKIPEEDIDKVGRIRLECKPWCRLFYEDCDRDIGAPAHSALDHIHSVVMDDAYRRGYRDGKDTNVPIKWIPFKTRPLTEEEKEEHPEWDCILDCKLPDDGQRILVNIKYKSHEAVQMDEFYTDDGCYLDSGYEIGTEATAWMPLPQPYKEE